MIAETGQNRGFDRYFSIQLHNSKTQIPDSTFYQKTRQTSVPRFVSIPIPIVFHSPFLFRFFLYQLNSKTFIGAAIPYILCVVVYVNIFQGSYLDGLRSHLGGLTQRVKSWYWGRPLVSAIYLNFVFSLKQKVSVLIPFFT